MLYDNSVMGYVLEKGHVEESDVSMLRANLNSFELNYKNAMNLLDLPFHTVLIGFNGFTFVTGHDYDVYDYASFWQKKWFKEIVNSSAEYVWTRTHTENDNGEFFVSLARPVVTDRGNRGIIMVSVPERAIKEQYSSTIENGNHIYILDSSGRILSDDSQKDIGEEYAYFDDLQLVIEGQDYIYINREDGSALVSHYTDPGFGWTYVEEIPRSAILLPALEISKILIAPAVIISCLSVLVSLLLVRATTRPLHELSNQLQMVSNGHLDTRFTPGGWKEIAYISEVSDRMTKQIAALIENTKQEEELKRKAELRTLRMQINPHFMLNTLFSIKCMVGMEENEKAEQMLTAFISMLREVLRETGKEIPLMEELTLTEQYLILLKYRFGDGFQVVYDISPEAQQCRVLKMILQPVIENSVIHGLEQKGGHGTVHIHCYTREDYLILEVSDDGVGMSEERLEEENAKLKEPVSRDNLNGKGSIGNRNVSERITVSYGNEYGMRLKLNEEGGVTTVIVLPRIPL